MVDLQKIREKYEQLNKGNNNSSNGDTPFLIVKNEGEYPIRVLPWEKTDDEFYAESAIHYLGEDRFHCPAVKGHKCPVCEAYFELWDKINNTGDGKDDPQNEELIKLARGIKPNKRFYMNVIDREDGQIKIFSTGYKVFNKILKTVLNENYWDEDGNTVLSEEAGNDFILTMNKIGGFNNYDQSYFVPRKTPLGDVQMMQSWEERLHDIHGIYSDADINKMKDFVAEMWDTVKLATSAPSKSVEEDDGEVDYLSHLDSNLDIKS